MEPKSWWAFLIQSMDPAREEAYRDGAMNNNKDDENMENGEVKVKSREQLVEWLRNMYTQQRKEGLATTGVPRGWCLGIAEQARGTLLVMGEPDPAETET